MGKESSLSRLLAATMALVLAVGLLPLPAFASDLTASSFEATTQGTSSDPTPIALGRTKAGHASLNHDQWYSFETTGGHSAYRIELVSKTEGELVHCALYDSYGKKLAFTSTKTNTSKSVLLSTNTTYKLKVDNIRGADFTIRVVEVPSKPQYKARGNDKNNPYKLTLSKAINSQFDNRSGVQDQWFTFKTTSSHSAYRIALFSRMDNQRVFWTLYDSYGNKLITDSTTTKDTRDILLSANSSYKLKVNAVYSGNSGYPSYLLKVTEKPSKPQYKARGKNKNKPFKLKYGKAVKSQFDDRDGKQEQWFTFKTTASKMPYLITLTSKTDNVRVYWNLYDYYGNWVASSNTTTRETKAVSLDKKMTYRLKVNASYNGETGFPSYQIAVNHLKLGTISKLKVKAQYRDIIVNYSKAKNATNYQIAYKKAGTKEWTRITTANRSYTLYGKNPRTRYNVKVRPAYYLSGTYYYGKWTKIQSATTQGY